MELKPIICIIHFCLTDEKNKKIELHGVKSSVEHTRQSINHILGQLHSTPSSTVDLNHIKQTGSHQDFIRALFDCNDVFAPIHWKTYRGSLKAVGGTKPQLTSVDGKLQQAVTSLIMSTWTPHLVGQGRDARSLSHQSIHVKKVWAIENVPAHKTYMTLMKELYKQKSGKVPSVKGLAGEQDIETVLKSMCKVLLFVSVDIFCKQWKSVSIITSCCWTLFTFLHIENLL